MSFRSSASPSAVFTRKHPASGRAYTNFAMLDAVDANQRRRVHGWYAQADDDGGTSKVPYSVVVRLIFPNEIKLMLERAGFSLVALEGGHCKEPFEPLSTKMFVVAKAV
jgi:hypothetical protein